MLFNDYYTSPVGLIYLMADEKRLHKAVFCEEIGEVNSNFITEIAIRQLNEYFNRERKDFDLPLFFEGTDFQVEVWKALQQIRFGEVISYIQLAKSIKRSGAVRAVGDANGKNPFHVIVPCHRIVGTNNSLTGYAGGLHRKEFLITHESTVKQGVLF